MDLFDYLWNQTFSQIEQKIDHLDQNAQWFISGMSKQIAQSKKHVCLKLTMIYNQIEHLMLVNKPS